MFTSLNYHIHRCIGVEYGLRLGHIACLAHSVPAVAEIFGQRQTDQHLILDDQDGVNGLVARVCLR